MLQIAVVDGQGGGIGRTLVEKLRAALGDRVRILALGTNALATSAMLRAGADEGATGENAIVYNAPRVQLIAGSIGIIAADAMLGELTPRMARAVAASPAEKILIPVNRCGLYVAGGAQLNLAVCLDDAVSMVCARLGVPG